MALWVVFIVFEAFEYTNIHYEKLLFKQLL